MALYTLGAVADPERDHSNIRAVSMRRPDSTQAPIPLWGEYDEGMQANTAPPPYTLESTASSRPTPSRANSSQKHAYEAPSPTVSSIAYSNTGVASASSSVLEMDAGDGSIPPPGDTGVTRMSTVKLYVPLTQSI